MFPGVLVLSCVIGQLIGVAVAQVVASCTASGWFNDAGVSACQLASTLGATCSTFDASVPPIPPGTYYTPVDDSQCTCSTVYYALMSGCAVCQGGVAQPWATWGTSCTNPVKGFWTSIPAGTGIPIWAYEAFDGPNEFGDFDPQLAQQIGNDPELPIDTTYPTTTIPGVTAISTLTSITQTTTTATTPIQVTAQERVTESFASTATLCPAANATSTGVSPCPKPPKLSKGAIAGIAIGGFIAALVVLAILGCICDEFRVRPESKSVKKMRDLRRDIDIEKARPPPAPPVVPPPPVAPPAPPPEGPEREHGGGDQMSAAAAPRSPRRNRNRRDRNSDGSRRVA